LRRVLLARSRERRSLTVTNALRIYAHRLSLNVKRIFTYKQGVSPGRSMSMAKFAVVALLGLVALPAAIALDG